MKKSIKLFAIGIALATFGLNLSVDSYGNFSLLSKANADAEESTTNPPGWRSVKVACLRPDGTQWGSAFGCMNGIMVDCDPQDCGTDIPPTTPPDTNE